MPARKDADSATVHLPAEAVWSGRLGPAVSSLVLQPAPWQSLLTWRISTLVSVPHNQQPCLARQLTALLPSYSVLGMHQLCTGYLRAILESTSAAHVATLKHQQLIFIYT